MKRRHFLKTTAAAATLLGYFPAGLSNMAREKNPGKLEKRTLGRTGEKLSFLGFGGLVVTDASPSEATERVAEAIDHGINYFDVAPSYGDAEIKLGPALEPYRSKVFLACKTMERKKEGALKELERSLTRMRTDRFDLYQLHAMTSREDVETVFSPDGALNGFLQAKREGKIRFIGFSAHSVEAATALMERFDFDTILFPINFATWHAGNFGPQVLAMAQEKGLGILALKAMARGPWPKVTKERTPKCWYRPLSDPEDALLGLRFTLSHAVTAAIPPGNENLFRLALHLADKFEPLSPDEVREMKEKGSAEQPLFRYPQN